jgi:hypothetical protein
MLYYALQNNKIYKNWTRCSVHVHTYLYFFLMYSRTQCILVSDFTRLEYISLVGKKSYERCVTKTDLLTYIRHAAGIVILYWRHARLHAVCTRCTSDVAPIWCATNTYYLTSKKFMENLSQCSVLRT